MNTAVLRINWFSALAAWLRTPARRRIAQPVLEDKPRVRIAGLR